MSRPLRLILPLIVIAVGAALAILRPWEQPPLTVVLISIDTLRPQRLGLYGNDPDVSPRIDKLAKDAVVFDQALALSPWTLPSHMTMLTGLDPVAHGVRNAEYKLSTKVVTLAEALAAAGFRTAAFTDGGFVVGAFGFDQGFEIYDDQRNFTGGPNGFARLLPKALDWIEDATEKPSFVFLHTFDVHSPYADGDPKVLARFRERPVEDGPDDYALFKLTNYFQQVAVGMDRYTRMNELINDYDSGVFEADRGVGRVLDLLDDSGRLDNALVIVTSDHGESFYDRELYIGHGINLTDDELHVPLIVRFPRAEGAGMRVPDLVDLSDLPRTVLEIAGVTPPEHMGGESLVGLMRGKPRHRDFAFGLSQNTEAAMLVTDGYKFISPPSIDPMLIAERHLGPMTPPSVGVTEEGEAYEILDRTELRTLHYDTRGDPLGVRDALQQVPQLYDRVHDPKEQHNLYKQEPQRAELMAAKLKEMYVASLALNEELDDGQREAIKDPHLAQQLAALGYLSEGKRTTLNELPLSLREQLTSPYTPPDTTQLTRIDRRAHAARLAVAAGEENVNTGQILRQLADNYTHWAVRNPEYIARIGWRIAALMDIGRDAEVNVNPAWWETLKRRFSQQMMLKQARDAAAAAELQAASDEADEPPR